MAGRPKRGLVTKSIPPAPSFVPAQQQQQQQYHPQQQQQQKNFQQQQGIQQQQQQQKNVQQQQGVQQQQQQKNLQQQQAVQQQQQPQQQQPPTVQQQPQIPPQQKPMLPQTAVKEESNGTPAPTPMIVNDFSENDGEKKTSLFKKLFAGVRRKTTTRVKKLRQNRRLRRILLPKNALMALHEIQGIKMSDFVINPRVGGGFTAEVMVNNIQYEGSGPSKLSAKNSVCEKALRDLIISKMMLNPSKHSSSENIDNNEEMKTDAAGEDEDVEMKEGDEDEDVPMINLASYALYKLFSEWENEGFEVPEFRNHSSPNNNSQSSDKPKKPPTIRNELPPNWETMHPTTLLCMMRPGISYTELGCEGFAPNQTQKMGVTVDGEHFIGKGRSKKLARRDAACLACNKLFGTNFQKEE